MGSESFCSPFEMAQEKTKSPVCRTGVAVGAGEIYFSPGMLPSGLKTPRQPSMMPLVQLPAHLLR